MKIISVGLSKTGATSLADALKILGFSVRGWPDHLYVHRKQWFDLYFDGVEPDFTAMYGDVDAVTHLPPACWFEEILKCFPDAKVILTVRDSEDVWLQSFVRHSSRFSVAFPKWHRLFPTARKEMDLRNAVYNFAYGSDIPKNVHWYGKKYREHNERVQAVVPASQLLVFNVKEGWQPLCDFLGCEVPLKEFPRRNVSSSDYKDSLRMRRYNQQNKREACFLLAVLVAVVSVFILLISRVF